MAKSPIVAKSRVRAGLLASAALLAAPPLASAAPLVANGGFETTPDTAWVLGSSPLNSISLLEPQTGSYAFRSGCIGAACVTTSGTGVGGTGSLSQSIVLAPGLYRLDYALDVNSATAPNRFAVSLGNNILRDQSNLGVQAYTAASHLTTVSGGATTLAFAVRHDASVMNLDNVALTLVDDGAGNALGAAALGVAAQASAGFLDRLHDRLAVPAAEAASGSAGPFRAFMGGYGDRSRWDDGATRSRRWGLTGGAALDLSSGLNVGVSAAAGRVRFSTASGFTGNNGEGEEYLAMLHAHWSPGASPLYVSAAAGYGEATWELRRASLLSLGTVAARDVTSSQVFGSLEAGYDWQFMPALRLTPYLRADAARIDQDGYTELALSGATLVPATVAGTTADALRTILGLRTAIDITAGRRGARLTASAGWAHQFERDRAVSFAETSGSVTFTGTATAATPAADAAVLAAGVEAPIDDNARFFAGYNGTYASGQDSHAAELGLRVAW